MVVSRDLFLRTGGLVLGLLAVTAAAARIGAVVTAAHQVIFQVWIFVSFFMDGFAIAAQAMVGTALGAGDEEEARATSPTCARGRSSLRSRPLSAGRSSPPWAAASWGSGSRSPR
ncbi:MAG: MATE family efflux transporter [Nitriliruptorales bacterium]